MRFLAFILCILTANAAFCGDKIDKNTVLFAAADVPNSTLDIVKTWYRIGVDAWGSYGPTEIYVVGNSLDAATDLEDAFCERRKKLDQN